MSQKVDVVRIGELIEEALDKEDDAALMGVINQITPEEWEIIAEILSGTNIKTN